MKTKSQTKRKKDPENVRLSLLRATAKLASEQGVPAITLSLVSKAAGVTKGALFHHFENKRALIVAMMDFLIERMDEDIDALIAKDAKEYGVFTRAYVQVMLDLHSEYGKAFSSLLLSEPEISALSAAWYGKRMKMHAKTDSDQQLEIIRYAADGAWLAAVTNYNPKMDIGKIRKRLVEMSHGKKASRS
ncbi:TetR/AcrR family transcriptional regulator [Bdellovibrio bacteriovorus]|uniref:Transcriptional regulator, TetR family n=1 Tax=Bdellovibrio bacteriovorus str. Tiberius TaxID=1069642 RepID=K7ZBL1_BDEBC|nr:TetR/AcrR family transcriptional regulator [Bdellovibrio bacteriovorus]AFY02414.1 transcriptional regulator, TetR family [Bdellovibrio bacteriovorus str. Tiberius]